MFTRRKKGSKSCMTQWRLHHENQPALLQLGNKHHLKLLLFFGSHLPGELPLHTFHHASWQRWFQIHWKKKKKKRESSFKSSTSNFGDLWVGDLQGLHVVGTQCAVVAVGDTVRTTDLLQDEGAGCDGFAAWGLSQVCGAIKLGRKSNNAGPAAGSWERASATVCLLSSSRFWKLLPEENQGLF